MRLAQQHLFLFPAGLPCSPSFSSPKAHLWPLHSALQLLPPSLPGAETCCQLFVMSPTLSRINQTTPQTMLPRACSAHLHVFVQQGELHKSPSEGAQCEARLHHLREPGMQSRP
jgi:hypothetical protein